MSLLSKAETQPRDKYNNPMTRTMIAGLLGLDDTQTQHFNGLVDTLNKHQAQLKPPVRQFQAKARLAFASQRFSAAELTTAWRALSLARENRSATETALALISFWKTLGPTQRERVDAQLGSLQARWHEAATASLAELHQKQSARLRAITAGMKLDAAQLKVLQSLVIDPKAVNLWQQGIRKELEGVHARLKAPGANLRSVEAVILPLYHNERYFKVQLEKLQALHARLSPAQRAQILKALS